MALMRGEAAPKSLLFQNMDLPHLGASFLGAHTCPAPPGPQAASQASGDPTLATAGQLAPLGSRLPLELTSLGEVWPFPLMNSGDILGLSPVEARDLSESQAAGK